MGRYRLVFDDFNKNTTKNMTTYERGNLKYKVDLQSIDLFLLNDIFPGYKTKEDIVNQRNLLGSDFSEETNVLITYQHDGKTKKIVPLVGSNPEVSYFAYETTTVKEKQEEIIASGKKITPKQKEELLKYITDDIIWISFVKDFFKALKNGNFVNYYKSKIDSYNSLIVEDYIRNIFQNSHEETEALDIAEYNLKRMLTNYRMIRETISIMQEFEKKKNIQLLSIRPLVERAIKDIKNDKYRLNACVEIHNYGLSDYDILEPKFIHQDIDQAEHIFSMEDLKELFPEKYSEICDNEIRLK